MPQQAAEEINLKTNIAIAALFTAGVFLTPAHASSVLFTATSTLPATGTTWYPTATLSLSDNAGSITAYGFDGVFSTTTPPTSLPSSAVSSATPEPLDVGTYGLGLKSNDTPYIGPTDAVLLDFASVNNPATYEGQMGSISQVTFNLRLDINGSSDWTVYGMSGATGGSGTLIDSGPMWATVGTFSVTETIGANSPLYSSYLIGVTSDCALTIESVDIQYSGTTTQQTPEPGTFVMAGIAMLGLGVTLKKRNRKV